MDDQLHRYPLPRGWQLESPTRAHLAVLKGRDVSCADAHIAARATLHQASKKFRIQNVSVLHLAAFVGRIDVLQTADIRLLQEDFAEQNRDVMQFAARGNQPEAMRVLLGRGVSILHEATDNGTALYIAAQDGSTEAVEVAVAAGAPIDAICDGWTPLLVAAFRGHVATVEALCRLGASTAIPTKGGATPMVIAAQEGHMAIVEALHRHGAWPDEAMLESGATATFMAAQNGHHEMIRLLWRLGADPNKSKRNGFSPADVAAQNDHAEAMRALHECGADVITRRDPSTRTMLWISAAFGSVATAEYLMSIGVDRTEVVRATTARERASVARLCHLLTYSPDEPLPAMLDD